MLVGYARVSTQDQSPELQLDALRQAGCEKVFTEQASGAQRDRPELRAALDYMRGGDSLVVWRLDRLARSLKQLIETVEELDERKVGFRSLTESIDTTTNGGRLIFHIFGALAEFERTIIGERTRPGRGQGPARRPRHHGRGGRQARRRLSSHALPAPARRSQRTLRSRANLITSGHTGEADCLGVGTITI